jgi:hypothetical protein
MDIRLLYFDDCPNWRIAQQRLEAALQRLNDHSLIVRERIDRPEKAEQIGFMGSPTILINGSDPVADQGAPVGLSCRIYLTPAGTEPAPTIEQLESALANAH